MRFKFKLCGIIWDFQYLLFVLHELFGAILGFSCFFFMQLQFWMIPIVILGIIYVATYKSITAIFEGEES